MIERGLVRENKCTWTYEKKSLVLNENHEDK